MIGLTTKIKVQNRCFCTVKKPLATLVLTATNATIWRMEIKLSTQPMKLPLQEPLFAKYLYLSSDNILHAWMPIVSGEAIGLDNTCKAVYALQEFFGKGSNSNKKVSLNSSLLAYQEALESDFCLLNLLETNSHLVKQKLERLTQINCYLETIKHLEKHEELNCLNSGFPSYPRPLEGLMQGETSNLYSIILHPTHQDAFLRSEGANPLFSVAHISVARGIHHTESLLQQALIQAYGPLNYERKDLKSQVIEKTALIRREQKTSSNLLEILLHHQSYRNPLSPTTVQ
ncbi:hypothetical protein Lsan_2971 [Legionella santicrucis]|uniref:SidC N-terminal domain-containing protein n=1 Tax=Legionella santicrucis TaxID=45074 RepID=A0A0W0YJ12_9GAMM|nr:hypothetical protein [Legionella santicrucis]KTD56811.1 hypothetical protein Lsan_2971 [Legionella santicrucis]